MVVTTAFTKTNYKFYKSTVQEISKVEGDCTTKVRYLCESFLDIGVTAKSQVGNGLSKIFDFLDQTIDVSDQAFFTLKYSGLHEKEGNKISISNLLIAT